MQTLEVGPAVEVDMREGMRRLASGVCVISSVDQQQQPFAMTATSVTSVSDTPPSLLVCVNKQASIHSAISASGRFCVNLLSRQQEDISNRCSGGEEGIGRFAVGNWNTSAELPYLQDCLAVFTCKTEQQMDYGTHRIFIARIEKVAVPTDAIIEPLIYLNGGYR
ncbi:MAG: flavin reductase family protein [Gammaproteobacteria bacterium]|uniref:flavin reductase family protein n=1 Tax=Pseudomaricurvus alcaniphilus TaxID=1166482 RepID=UPI001408DAC8|nr:flavin reductase family protein [Pseudomaricurvus alcaniphilus]MBR9912328.1 flavin reductase family protein [Gammaproteobacteria bacterium]NHN39312.1 flavin reductase family protein [Pseudomaricurvus alcaniphilus]